MFNRECKTRNQACNREVLTKLFSHNRIENVINIENNSFSEKQADEYNKTFIHVHDTFISSEDEIEIDYISSMSVARKLKE